MADSEPFRPVTLYDTFGTVEGGMNSGLDPLLLQKNQLAFASNLTTRQGFATDRPAFTNRLTITWPSPEIQTAFEQGLFQGAAYYQPDSGNQSLFAAVSGRLYQFQISGNEVTTFDRTVPGDPNPATSTQAWLWQAENFLIWNDGLSLPPFFDGATTRRSYGPSVLLGLATGASPAAPPPIGQQVVLTLSAPYTGLFNVPVLYNGEFYQAIENAGGYDVNMTNLTDVPGTPINVDDQVVIRGDVFGVQATTVSGAGGQSYPANGIRVTFTMTTPFQGAIGSQVLLYGKVWATVNISPNLLSVQVENQQPVTFPVGDFFTAGQVLLKAAAIVPNVIIGNVAAATVAPAVGSGVLVTLNQLYSGLPNQSVFIGDRQYTATAVPSGSGTSTLRLVNLSDTSIANYVFTSPKDEILSVPELPAGRMGAYGLAQNWVALVDGLSFICSDISRGASGTQANNGRDAVLKTTDITFNGGNFAIPGAGSVITSLTFTANLDLSLGQGSLQVGTAQFMASCRAPIDFTNPPQNGPILTFSLIGTGPLNQDATIRVNSDVLFRSVAGLGSLIQARRDFDTPGNTPISQEMNRVFQFDNETLLQYGSSINFDNRFITTASPQASSQGVLHAGLVVQNLDPVSGIKGKLPPVYDGLWTGLNVLKLVTGIFNGRQRAFAFTFNITLSKLELYELLPTGPAHFDNETIPIVWSFETASLFNKEVKPLDQLISLRNGELALDDIVGRVRVQVWWRPDQYGGQWQQACWTPWHDETVCAAEGSKPLYIPRLGLGEPDSTPCDPTTKTPLRDGYTFQVKVQITGHCRVLRARFAAVTVAQPKFEPPTCNEIVQVQD